MRKKTRNLAVTALMLAVAVVLLYIASVAPTAQLAFSAMAGLGIAACVIEGGLFWGLGCWVGAALLGAFLVPDKGSVLLFAVFFGIYPVLKSIFEKPASRVLEWIFKAVFFNIALCLCYLCWHLGFLPEVSIGDMALWIIWIIGNLAFVVYDLGFSRLIAFYIARVASKRRGK